MDDPLFPRRHDRVGAIALGAVVESAGIHFDGTISDASVDGMFFACRHRPPAGAEVGVAVTWRGETLRFAARVVRVAAHGVGLRLVAPVAGWGRWLTEVAAERAPAAVARPRWPPDSTAPELARRLLDAAGAHGLLAALALPDDAPRDAVAARVRAADELLREFLLDVRMTAANPDAAVVVRARAMLGELERREQQEADGARATSDGGSSSSSGSGSGSDGGVVRRGAPPPAANPTGTLLIVDDSATARSVLKIHIALMKGSFTIIEAGDAQQARAVLAERADVNLVICDMVMPGMTGLELLAALRSDPQERLRTLPFVLITGDGELVDLPVQAKDAGASAVVYKPSARLPTGRLTDVVRQLLPPARA